MRYLTTERADLDNITMPSQYKRRNASTRPGSNNNRLASHRQISINITFEEGLQSNFGLDSSTGASGVSWPDSSSDAQIECESAAPDPAPEIPSVAVQEPIDTVSLVQPVVFVASSSLQSSVDPSQRILHIEQALLQCVILLSSACINILRILSRQPF